MNAQLDNTRNCTLEGYACAKGLPVDLLRSLGLETIPNPYALDRRAVQIPYPGVGWEPCIGTESAPHSQRSADGDGRLLGIGSRRAMARSFTDYTASNRFAGTSFWPRARAIRRPCGSGRAASGIAWRRQLQARA